ncbi:DUF2497 domain-containing protein [Alphaproteobacteria bacterium]|jgi:uncharacterized protein|nr:DUF2497 domain-containing protein [Alphaproteobacteria bacterium]
MASSSDKLQGQTEGVLSAIRSLIEDDMDKSQIMSPSKEAELKKSLETLSTISSTKPTFLEATIADTVRPLVKEWLAENLPDMVENIVRKEIKRLTKGK